MSQIDDVIAIAEGMIGIGGIPSNEEFYSEFNFRVQSKLAIKNQCEWNLFEDEIFGYVWKTSCGETYDYSKTSKYKFCPNCGCFVF